MMFIRPGTSSAIILGLVVFSAAMMGVAHGASASSVEEAYIDEQLTTEDLEESRQPTYPLISGAWVNKINDIGPEPNPWMQDKIHSFVLAVGNGVFAIANAASVWAFHNREWISPVWFTAVVRVGMGGAMLALLWVQYKSLREIAAEAT